VKRCTMSTRYFGRIIMRLSCTKITSIIVPRRRSSRSKKKENTFQTGCVNAQKRRLTVRTLVNGRVHSRKRNGKPIVHFYEYYFPSETISDNHDIITKRYIQTYSYSFFRFWSFIIADYGICVNKILLFTISL